MRLLSTSIAPGAPSIFSARWFQFLLGGLLALLITVLLVPYAAERGAAPVLSAVVLEPVAAPRFGMASDDAMAQPVTPSPAPAVTGGDGAGGAYRVQVGAFAEPAEADRLAARLRGEGFPISERVVERPRWLYRILVIPPPGGSQALMAEIQGLGLSAAPGTQGLSGIGPLPLRRAVEAARRLDATGIEVRLIRETAKARLHVVRVGGFATPEEAEQARRDLAGRGLDGVVIREGP